MVQRIAAPKYKIVILNKKKRDNFEETIKKTHKFKANGPIVQYRETSEDKEQEGTWKSLFFNDEGERTQLVEVVSKLVEDLAKEGDEPMPL